MDGTVLWDRVHIADGVEIHHSVICDEAEVKEEVKLMPRCVLSSQVSRFLSVLLSASLGRLLILHCTIPEFRAAPSLFAEVETVLLLHLFLPFAWLG